MVAPAIIQLGMDVLRRFMHANIVAVLLAPTSVAHVPSGELVPGDVANRKPSPACGLPKGLHVRQSLGGSDGPVRCTERETPSNGAARPLQPRGEKTCSRTDRKGRQT